MRYFLDTEFAETGGTDEPTIDLISIGIVSEDGREYYAESNAFDMENVSDWVLENVVNKCRANTEEGFKQKNNIQIGAEVITFIGDDRKPEFWAYYADYDWVVFCWLFGTMMDLPSHYPKLCMDLQQWWLQLGKPDYLKPPGPEDAHNALADAHWNKRFHKELSRICTLMDTYCPVHDFHHGAEASELRQGIEEILKDIVEDDPEGGEVFTAMALRGLLDKVDARDSCAHEEIAKRRR